MLGAVPRALGGVMPGRVWKLHFLWLPGASAPAYTAQLPSRRARPFPEPTRPDPSSPQPLPRHRRNVWGWFSVKAPHHSRPPISLTTPINWTSEYAPPPLQTALTPLTDVSP